MTWSDPVRARLHSLLTTPSKSKIAVFDADGTLWHGDAGDGFFLYQAKNGLAPGLKGVSDPWTHYKKFCEKNPNEAYAWLAQINAGLKERDLRKQAEEFYRHHFPSKPTAILKTLIDDLKGAGFEIWVCSASHRWAVEPAMDDLKLPRERLVAVEVKVRNGILTDEPVTPVPYRLGKKLCLQKKLSAAPLFVAGNSMGDFEMLEMATDLPLVVIYQPHLPDIKASEETLIMEARARHWPIQFL